MKITKRVYKKVDLDRKTIDKVVKEIFNCIEETLMQENSLTIDNFGRFRTRPIFDNKLTRELGILDYTIVTFKPAKKLTNTIQGKYANH